ncbi:MAG: hypothetical protein M1826_005455 [Phylliscum demangeonii]|nr:MAG: hypothetical protein M1826_005455 [Phylliscum demangeonii]
MTARPGEFLRVAPHPITRIRRPDRVRRWLKADDQPSSACAASADRLSRAPTATTRPSRSPSYTATAAAPSSPAPPSFSSLYHVRPGIVGGGEGEGEGEGASSDENVEGGGAGSDRAPSLSLEKGRRRSSSVVQRAVADTKAALPPDPKARAPASGPAGATGAAPAAAAAAGDDNEPPPPYTEGSSPLASFIYLMAAAGGPAALITQVQQGGPPINTLGDVGADENINLDLRGTRFALSRDELLTLPEFVLLSLFPNGLLPDGHAGAYPEEDVYPVDYDPASLQYMLDFFRNVAQTIPSRTPSPNGLAPDGSDPLASGVDPSSGSAAARDPSSAKDMLQDRAGIIVLREDLDFYAIPPRADVEQQEMIEVKRAAGRALLRQDGIFSGLRKSEEAGTTEQHLIEMLTAGVSPAAARPHADERIASRARPAASGFNHDDAWGHRAGEPNKAVICSLALARLRTTDVNRGGGGGGDGGLHHELVNGGSGSGSGGGSGGNGSQASTNGGSSAASASASASSSAAAAAAAVGMAQKLLLFWRKPARRCWWEGVELADVEGVDGTLKVWIRRVWTLEMSVIGLR